VLLVAKPAISELIVRDSTWTKRSVTWDIGHLRFGVGIIGAIFRSSEGSSSCVRLHIVTGICFTLPVPPRLVKKKKIDPPS
jgi:hypothetical protein